MENQNKATSGKVIPPGYKLTEVGVIPEDWLLQKLGLHASFRTGPFGSALHKSDYVDGGIPVVNPMQIVDGKVVPTFSMAISGDAAKKLAEFRLSVGDVVIGRRGDMGRCAVITEKENGWLCGTGSMIIRVKPSCDAAFLQRILSSASVISAIENTSVGTTMINLNQGTLRELQIVLPKNKNEQTAIANALSDTDELIATLEHLIAKKKSIKTATMQQLLTGRTRLAQFAKQPNETLKGYKTSELGMIPEDWEAKPFGELFESSLHRRTMRKEDIVSFVGMQDVSENAQLIEQSQLSFSEVKGGFTYFEKGDVLVAKITPCFENGKGCHTESLLTDIGFGSTEFHVLRAKNSSHSKFIYYWTTNTNLRKVLESEMVGSAGHRRVPLSAIQNYLIPCPQTKIEQTAIATILSDMDDELEALEQKLAKVRDIKQGMMQQLLTGRIRLPLDHQP